MSTPSILQHARRQVDTSGRLSLGRAQAGAEYDVAHLADGRIVLTPMVSVPAVPLDAPVPERERWLFDNPGAMALVDKGLAELGTAKGASLDLSPFLHGEE